MTELQDLIRPLWAANKWLSNTWSVLKNEEKNVVVQRMDALFSKGLPFQMEHNKILYVHLFAMLAQIEIVSSSLLLKPIEEFKGKEFERKLRLQLVDKVFHAALFIKITYELSTPYASPLIDNQPIDLMMKLVNEESDYRTALILIGLIAENVIEDLFIAIEDIAPQIVGIVRENESRHMKEFEIYREIGLPNLDYLRKRIATFSDEFLKLIFSQKDYVRALVNLIGVNGFMSLIHNVDKKYCRGLSSIEVQASAKWQFFMKNIELVIPTIFHDNTENELITQTTTRKIFSSSWKDPDQPTQFAMFSVNVSSVKFFEKKYPPETITCLVLQTISKKISNYPTHKNYIVDNKIYQSKDAYVGLAVQLPGCGDHLGMIEFQNCHEISLLELSLRIQNDIKLMTFCYKKVKELQIEHPHLINIEDQLFLPKQSQISSDVAFARPAISISNIGRYGYDSACSPLFPNEVIKYTLTKIERKQVWNNEINAFEIQDILPVGLSVDHRVFDANIPEPLLFQEAFDEMFQIMHQASPLLEHFKPNLFIDDFINFSENLLIEDLELGFIYLFFSAQIWKNYGVFPKDRKKLSFIDGLKESLGFKKVSLAK